VEGIDEEGEESRVPSSRKREKESLGEVKRERKSGPRMNVPGWYSQFIVADLRASKLRNLQNFCDRIDPG
jgi:hypothetical protein